MTNIDWYDRCQTAEADLLVMRAEVERLQANIKTIHTQKEADIRRLAIECGKANDDNKQNIIARACSKSPYLQGSSAERMIDELATEIERLQAALQDVVYSHTLEHAWEISRAALERKP